MNKMRSLPFALSGAFALAAAFVAMPAHADGECLQWNVTGPWTISQSNGMTVRMNLEQNATHLQGVGEYSYYSNSESKVKTMGGPVDGYLENGSLIRVTAYWSDGTAGGYTGQLGADGSMSGFTVDKNDPGNKATFRASGVPQCVARAAVAPPPPAKPALALGRVHAPAGTPVGPPKTMCETAASARARNSPAAPALEKRCAEWTAAHPVALGRVPTPAPPAPPAAPAPAPTSLPTLPAAPPMDLPPVDPDQVDALAAKGAEIAGIDPTVAEARVAKPGMMYQLGFDIATGLFGDPILGTEGKTAMDAESISIRNSLSTTGQRGFDAGVKFHLARAY